MVEKREKKEGQSAVHRDFDTRSRPFLHSLALPRTILHFSLYEHRSHPLFSP